MVNSSVQKSEEYKKLGLCGVRRRLSKDTKHTYVCNLPKDHKGKHEGDIVLIWDSIPYFHIWYGDTIFEKAKEEKPEYHIYPVSILDSHKIPSKCKGQYYFVTKINTNPKYICSERLHDTYRYPIKNNYLEIYPVKYNVVPEYYFDYMSFYVKANKCKVFTNKEIILPLKEVVSI